MQTGTQQRSEKSFQTAVELVRNGRIGRLQAIRITLPAGTVTPQPPNYAPVPDGFDYDMWLGPAPFKPFRTGLHMFHWRWNRDYSGGNLTDYLDTGLFLDDRLLRRWVRDRASGGSFLNLFAYTCTASVAAAAGAIATVCPFPSSSGRT